MTKLLPLLLLALPYSGRITLINVGNLSEDADDIGHKDTADHEEHGDNNTIVVGVLLPRNIVGSNDVVAKVSVKRGLFATFHM